MGSLRQAMFDANATPGADVINFDIDGTGVKTIAPASPLPEITSPVSINGYSQPGAQPNSRAVGSDAVLKVELSGAGVPGQDGLVLGTSGSTIKGLVINRFDEGILVDPGATGNRIAGNYIGTDRGGAAPLGNGFTGVSISLAPSNTIGGTTAGARNVISANALDGVAVSGDTATGNRILSNSIFANVQQGIDLGDDGPTVNDPGDPDTGANSLQNKPVLTSAKKSATGTTTVRGTLNSNPDKTFTVQFFSNPEGTNEGKTLLGSKAITTDGTGDFSFAFSTKKQVRLGQNITATATGADGTSEFSAPKKVVAR